MLNSWHSHCVTTLTTTVSIMKVRIKSPASQLCQFMHIGPANCFNKLLLCCLMEPHITDYCQSHLQDKPSNFLTLRGCSSVQHSRVTYRLQCELVLTALYRNIRTYLLKKQARTEFHCCPIVRLHSLWQALSKAAICKPLLLWVGHFQHYTLHEMVQ